MEGEPDPVAPLIELAHPETSDFLRYSIDLLNSEYYWESHVYFESLWNAHGRVGNVADFLKGMIKLGAAGVKMTIDQKVAADGHLMRARELFELVKKEEGSVFLGFDLNEIINKINHALDSADKRIVILPKWD